MGSSGSSFATNCCACVPITFLVGTISWSVDNTKHYIPTSVLASQDGTCEGRLTALHPLLPWSRIFIASCNIFTSSHCVKTNPIKLTADLLDRKRAVIFRLSLVTMCLCAFLVVCTSSRTKGRWMNPVQSAAYYHITSVRRTVQLSLSQKGHIGEML